VLKNTRPKGQVFLTAPQDVLSDLSETKWRGMLGLRIRTNESFAPTPESAVPLAAGVRAPGKNQNI